MDAVTLKKLKIKTLIMFPVGFIILAAVLMFPAGSINYWQGWLFCTTILVPALFNNLYFLKKSPEFLMRRMKFKEKEVTQKKIIKISSIFFLIGFIIPGLDYRFGWSQVPFWLVILSNVIILGGYLLIFFTFKENPFAARTIEVFEDQKVINTGPYSVVRHPMYAGIIPIFLFTPLALGSYWALIPIVLACLTIITRILNEEKVLMRDLPGYKVYCENVRYRLIPKVW